MEAVQRRAALSERRVATYGDVAVRFDLVNPEAVLHQGARPAKQLLQLPQSERPHLHNQSQALSNRLSAQLKGLTGGQSSCRYSFSFFDRIRVGIGAALPHQVADVNNAGDFAARWRRLPGGANGIVDCDGHSRFLLTDGAADEGVTGRHCHTG